MDFAAKLNSSSVRDQWEAALFLRSEGANGVAYLPLLLQKCQAIDSTEILDRHNETLLGFGAMTLGGLIAESGYNADDPLHNQILQWIIESTNSPNINVAGHSVYALGGLGRESSAARERLCEIANADLRGDEHKDVSLRAVALRLVRRIDPASAATFVDAPAFDEYAHAVEHWIASEASKNSATRLELERELAWLTETKNRRTKP
jgi:hypothetical protein